MEKELEIIVSSSCISIGKLLLGTTNEGSLVFVELEDLFVGLAVGKV
ncbi:8215_t:CDS:2 [Gigaspora rosea]|nr:8215_t:CDS:2 [Gigaspora rosea]